MSRKEFYPCDQDWEERGQWFIPGTTEFIAGILSFNHKKGLKLELFGAFNSDNIFTTGFKYPILFGYLKSSQKITLIENFCTNSEFQFDGGSYETYVPSSALIGIHTEKPFQIRFNAIRSYFINLNEWFGNSGLNYERIENTEFAIAYRRPKNFKCSINSDYRIEINNGITASVGSLQKRTAHITETVYVNIEGVERILKTWLDRLDHMMSFLSFASLEYCYPKFVILLSKNYTQPHGDKIVRSSIIYVHSRKFIPEIPEQHFRAKRIFEFKHVQKEIDTLLKNWFVMKKKWKPVFNSFLSAIYNKDMFLEDRFLNVSQALENFHAIKYNKHGNNPRLEERIKCLYENLLTSEVRKALGEKNLLASKIADSRNYYTHYNPRKKSKALFGKDLDTLLTKMRVLLIYCLLVEIGLTKEKSEKLVLSTMLVRASLKP